MSENPTLEEVRSAVADVRHPMIDKTLVELGILKQIEVEDGKAKILMAFPFPGIPIAAQLIDSVRRPLAAIGVEAEFAQTVMNEQERQRFLALEQEGWRGSF